MLHSGLRIHIFSAEPCSSVGCVSAWYTDRRRFDPPVTFLVEIGHEIIPMAILSQLLIQVEQLSVTGERMCTKYWLTAKV